MFEIATFSGTANQCGREYVTSFRREIAGFYCQEFLGYQYSKKFLKGCQKHIVESAPNLSKFIDGGASRSLLSLDEHILLMLHEEELYHRKLMNRLPHCSAIAVGASSKGAVIGQNWDWNTSYFPWSSINRFALTGFPRVLALSYPGLPICSGINSAGLSLMWTGSGYYPPLKPKVGVPTYALVFELLLRRDVKSAIEYLSSVKNSGAFIFLLGDRGGNVAVVEGVPGRTFYKLVESAGRANVYEFPEAISHSHQKLPSGNRCHSLKRRKILDREIPKLLNRGSVKAFKSTLNRPSILMDSRSSHATLVQLVGDCSTAELHLRGWQEDHWVKVKA